VGALSAAADSNPPGELYCTACEKTFHLGERCPNDGTRLIKLKARIDPFLGRELDGRYTVIEKLGQGGMGAVYRAEQHSVDREVAIKVINSTLVSEPEVIKRFLREAKLATRLSHPNAVTVLDFGQTEDGVFFLVMELVSGRTLDDVIKAEHQFRPERLVRIGAQICDALEGAHALSIIHRDLKPSNIMLMKTGRDFVKVLDFGLAKSTSPDHTSTTMTGSGAVVGTPAFMPPELATGEPCDARSDLYSLGVILYLMGSGRLPFMSDSVHELLAMHAGDHPAPPMTGVPRKLAAVIDKLLAKRPEDRYQTATDARAALEEALLTATPASGVPFVSDRSISNYPAAGEDETPLPGSLVSPQPSARKKPTNTAMQAIMTGETMLASSSAVAATSQPGVTAAPSARKRWPLFAVGGGVAACAIAVIAFALSRGDTATSNAPAPPPPPPPASIAKPVEPAVPPPHVESPPVTTDVQVGAGSGSETKPVEKTVKKTRPKVVKASAPAVPELPKETPKDPVKPAGTKPLAPTPF
jgi:serine/threonine-protein kinase